MLGIKTGLISTVINMEEMSDHVGGYYDFFKGKHWITVNKAYIHKLEEDPAAAAYFLADLLAHEIIHQACNIDGIADMDKKDKVYHAKAFKEQAEKYGLTTEDTADPKYGYYKTHLPKQMYLEMLKDETIQAVLTEFAPMEVYENY